MKLMYCFTRKHLSVTVWFRKFVCFFKKRHHMAKAALRWVPRDRNTISSVTTFTWKMPEGLNSTHSSFFMLENMWIIILPAVDWIHKILWILFQSWVPGNPKWIGKNSQSLVNSVHWWYQMMIFGQIMISYVF